MNEENNKVLAGLVLYNSDYDRLIECVRSLKAEVDEIVLFDNSPNEIEGIKRNKLIDEYGCNYIHSKKNLGMPDALNEIMKMAQQMNYEWVLTMNADSIVPKGMIKSFAPFFQKSSVGMICPQVIDKRRKYMIPKNSNRVELVNMCITSGTCTRVSAWKQVGGFDGWLFVDLLDNDLSKRFVLNGWKIVQINSVVLDQEYGEILPKVKTVEQFWVTVGKILHNDNFAKFSYRKIVHPNRVYYTCRNILYLNKKFAYYGGIGYDNYNCKTFIGFIICFVLPSILRADKKIEVIQSIIRGFSDGRKEKVKKWNANPMNF